MKKKKYEQQKAIELRKRGLSLSNISRIIHVSKSSVSAWVRDVCITNEQRKLLMKRRPCIHTNETKKKISKNSKLNWKNNPNMVSGNSHFRKTEKKYKSSIERTLKTSNLVPQKINGHWFDFVNDDYIVELTISNTGGINNAIKRFAFVKCDKREKFLFCPFKWFGKKRKGKLRCLNVCFIDVQSLRGDTR